MTSLKKYWIPKPQGEVVIKSAREKADFLKVGSSWIYGEILEEGIDIMVECLPEHGKGLFIDLGSGRGNVCAYLHVRHGFESCVGVELSETRWLLSNEIKKQASVEHDLSGVSFFNQDLYAYDISTADVLFANSLAFDSVATGRLQRKIHDEVKSGCVYVTTKRIYGLDDLPRLKKWGETRVKASWMDLCPLHIYVAH